MKGIFAAALCVALLPMAASAADLDYNYVDLAYSSAKSDTANDFYENGHGYRLDGSYGLGQQWFVEASYQRDRFDFSAPNIRVAGQMSITPEKSLLGGGFHFAPLERLDLFAHLDYGHGKSIWNAGGSTITDDDGYLAGVGVRFQATPALELDAGLDHDNLAYGDTALNCFECINLTQVRQGNTENVLSAAARYRFDWFGVGVEYRHGSYQGWRDWLFSMRANF